MNQAVFGIIGAGGIARSQHLGNLTRSPHVRLKAVCDLKPELVKDAQQTYDIPVGLTDHRQLLADREIQAVVIGTREDTHASLSIEALQAGKHVYVEKPMAETPEACQRVVEAQRKSGKFLAVGHNRRMAPAYQLAKKIFQAHGGAKNIHYRISDAYYIWGKNYPPGVRVIHETCHVFDLLRFLTDSDVTSIYCVASRPDDEILVLTFASGCVASITSSGYMKYDMPKESLEAVVDLGGLIVTEFVELQTFGLKDFDRTYRFAGHIHPERDTTHRYLLELGGVQPMLDIRLAYLRQWERLNELKAQNVQSLERKELETYFERGPLVGYMVDKGWHGAIDHFAECVLTGKKPMLADAEAGMKAMDLAQAAITSRETGQVVKL